MWESIKGNTYARSELERSSRSFGDIFKLPLSAESNIQITIVARRATENRELNIDESITWIAINFFRRTYCTTIQ